MRTSVFFTAPLSLLLAGALLSSCGNRKPVERDHVYSTTLHGIRLGDGVPLDLKLSTRWVVTDPDEFYKHFTSVSLYDSLILNPKSHEIASAISNGFPSVDSVFSSQRQEYISEIRKGLLGRLGEKGISVNEVILADIIFPPKYAEARELVGTKNQELERIKNKNEVDLASAQAAKLKAEADGAVAVENAKQEGELARIQAETERHHRASEMARAETARQVAETEAFAEARKIELVNDAEVKKMRDMKNVEMEKLRDMDDLALLKDEKTARICMENPAYASFMVNKELASKVQIAVLPSGSDANVFGDLLKQGIKSK
jgi:regulator of protease activity HflC (stomatin/prohibitin superfamily)